MTDEVFLRRATEEDSQSIDAGSIPIEICPVCKSKDIGSNHDTGRQRFYCCECTTTWPPEVFRYTAINSFNTMRDALREIAALTQEASLTMRPQLPDDYAKACARVEAIASSALASIDGKDS